MAALLIAISVMGIMLGVALPSWSTMIRREKEEELIFRGNQYARAIRLYQQKYGNANPPDLDVLIKERLLRKKYKDPLSPNKDGEFELCRLSSQMPSRGTQKPGTTKPAPQTGQQGTGSSQEEEATEDPCPSEGNGPITGVASKNTGQSFRILNGKNKYNEWVYEGVQQSMQAGGGEDAGAPGVGMGGRGGRGGGRGGQGSRGETSSGPGSSLFGGRGSSGPGSGGQTGRPAQ